MDCRRAVLLFGSRAAKPRLRLALEFVANRYRRLLGDRLVESTFGETVSFSRASAATDAAAGVITQFGIDVPRTASGILIESATTNLAPDRIFNSLSQMTAALTGPASPYNATSQALIPAAVSGSHYAQRTITVAAGATTVFSVALKAGATNLVNVNVYGTGNATFGQRFDLAAGTMPGGLLFSSQYTTDGGSGAVAGIIPLGNGWYRCWIAGIPDAAGTNRTCRVLPLDPSGASTFAGDGTTPYLYADAIQIEAAPLSSYIPTAGATATRATDIARIDGAAFAAIFGDAQQGWVVVDGVVPQAAGATPQMVFQVDDGTTTNRIICRMEVGTLNINMYRVLGGSGGTSGAGGVAVVGSPFRVGVKWNQTETKILGPSGVYATKGPAPTGLTVLRLGNDTSLTQALNGRVLGAWAGASPPSDATFQAMCAANADIDAILRSAA